MSVGQIINQTTGKIDTRYLPDTVAQGSILRALPEYNPWTALATIQAITFAGFPNVLPTNTAYIFSCNVELTFAVATIAGDRMTFKFQDTAALPGSAPIVYEYIPPIGTVGSDSFTITGMVLTPTEASALVGSAVLTTSGTVADYAFQIFNPTLTPIGIVAAAGAPSAPTGLVASAITDVGFTLNWTLVSASGAVYAATANGIPATSISPSSAVFTGLTASTTYSVSVSATNADGTAISAAISVETDAAPPDPPAAPTGLAAEDITDDSFVVSWTLVAGVTYTASATPGPVAGVVSGNSASFTGLAANTAYSVVITATNSAGSTPSVPLAVSTLPTPPPPPSPDPKMLMLSFLVPDAASGGVGDEWNISSILTPAGQIGMKTGVVGANSALNNGDIIGYLKNAQTAGYKVMVSMGGAAIQTPAKIFSDETFAVNLASSMAYALCRKGTSNPLGWSQLTTVAGVPFAFDGIDLDLEGGAPVGSFSQEMKNLLTFVQTLRAALRSGASNALLTLSVQGPDAYFGSDIINAYGETFIYPSSSSVASAYIAPAPGAVALIANLGLFDYVNVQYYNQGANPPPAGQPYGGWGPSDSPTVFPQSIGAYGYAAFIQSGGKTKIYPGLVSDPNCGPGLPGGSGPPIAPIPTAASLQPGTVAAVATAQTAVQAAPGGGATTAASWLAGFMSWDSPYAGNYLRELVNSTSLPTGWQLYGGQTYIGNKGPVPYPAYGPLNPGWDQNPPL